MRFNLNQTPEGYTLSQVTRVGAGNPRPPRTRCVGTALAADGTPLLTPEGRSTVRVLRPGPSGPVETIEPASAFARPRSTGSAPRHSRARDTTTAKRAEIERRLNCSDLPAIQGSVD